MRFNNPLSVAWPLHVLDLIMILINVVAVAYSVFQYRCGRPTYLVVWLSALFYGLILEFTTGMLISHSYIQGEFTAMLNTSSIPGYKTDMPLYILLLYPAINFLGFKLIESFGIGSVTARAVAAGAFTVLIDAPYVVNGPQPQVGWWRWLDWTIHGRHIFQYWYGWPMADAFWELTWPPLLMWLVWQWERRWAATEDDVILAKQRPLTTLVVIPVIIGLAVNTGGLLFSLPLGIAIGLRLPQYPVVVAFGVLAFGTLLFSDRRPAGLDRAGWSLLGIHVIGYGSVTLAQFVARPVPTAQIVIALSSLVALTVLAAYTSWASATRGWRHAGSLKE